MEPSYMKYKDELPENTIFLIKEIIKNIGLITEETNWLNSINGFYSLCVHIKGTSISANGKGTTPEYALASAYAELMERIQNQTYFRLNGNLSDEAFKSQGFYYAPDEIYMNIDSLLSSKNQWLINQFNKLDNSINKRDLLSNWTSIYIKDTGCDFVCLPYMNVMTNQISYIPVNTISKMYMSNGMCAGNTREEAVVQGLSEVFERVVNCKIIIDKITPPTIPDNYIEKFPKVYKMVESIRGIKGCNLIIKDCSLNRGYPVVGIILINQITQSYFVKFGSHPVFKVALERCLTELLQGQSIGNMKGMQEFKFFKSTEDPHQNLLGILVNGAGEYPNELFHTRADYAFKPFHNYEKKSNRELMKIMLDILKKEGHDVYIRDVSFLGFPSYHVIVSNFSEVEKIEDMESVNEYSGYKRMRDYIRRLSKLSVQNIYELLRLLNDYNLDGFENIMDLMDIPCNSRMLWYYNDMDLFLSMLYYSVGNFNLSYHCFEKYLMSEKSKEHAPYLYSYYKCVRDYIGTRVQNLNCIDSKALLVQFYDEPIVDEVFSHFEDYKNIFKHFGTYECWDCESCNAKDQCNYSQFERVYKILKEMYSSNPVNQETLLHLYS